MKRVTGLGGVFFKAADTKMLTAWYDKHLGLDFGSNLYHTFFWDDGQIPGERAASVFSVFDQETAYFSPSTQPFMINLRVENLDWLMQTLRAEGVQVVGEIESMEGIGKFGWIMNPAGNKIELWEPAITKE